MSKTVENFVTPPTPPRNFNIYGLELNEDSERPRRFTVQKPERSSEKPIVGVRLASNAENKTTVAATDKWGFFEKNINVSDKDDVQKQVEWMAQVM